MKTLILASLISIVIILFSSLSNGIYASSQLLVYAGKDQRVPEQSVVTLFSSAKDPLKSKLTYSWRQISGETVKLSASDVVKPTFVAPDVVSDETKTLSFEITISDKDGRNHKVNSDI